MYFSDETVRDQARKLREQGYSLSQIGKELGFHGTTVGAWLAPEQMERKRLYSERRHKLFPEGYSQRNLEWSRRHGKEYRLRHIAKFKAREVVKDALRSGRLTKKVCEKCGDVRAHAHHDDYSKPLEVRWLCDGHHREHHRQQGDTRTYR